MSAHVAIFFFFNDTATTEIYTLSLHDALPILRSVLLLASPAADAHHAAAGCGSRCGRGDRKSTRLNSSHVEISYAVFCLKKKKSTAATRSSAHAASAHSRSTTGCEVCSSSSPS